MIQPPDPSPPPLTTTKAQYDCNVGLADWQNSWDQGKREFCCENSGVGCPTQTSTTTRTVTSTTTSGFGTYDCATGLDNWQTEWGPVQKAWCCEHTGKGCPVKDPASCSDFTCPADHVKKADADKLFCGANVCTSADAATCCEEEERTPVTPSCSTFECPDGYFAKAGGENLFCTGAPCDVAVDTLLCCDQAITCDLNCYGDGATSVLLPGAQGSGDGAHIPGLTKKKCIETCMDTADCDSIVFGEGGGQCYGKKDVHTSKCQPGGNYITEVLRARPWGKCVLMGDPHIITFDRPQGPAVNGLVPGEYWLLKSAELLVQGRADYTEAIPKDGASTVGLAVGGPLVGGTLAVEYVGPKKGPEGWRVSWDGKQIFGKPEASGKSWSFASPDNDMQATYGPMDPTKWHTDARHTIGNIAGDLPSFLFKYKKAAMNIYILLGPDSCNVVIEAKKAPGSQDGYCGNFNCDPDDDTVEALKGRGLGSPLTPAISLFASSGSGKAAPKTPATAPEDAMDGCDKTVKAAAEEKCKALPEDLRKGCVFDACASNDASAAASDSAVEGLAEEVEDEEIEHH